MENKKYLKVALSLFIVLAVIWAVYLFDPCYNWTRI